MLQTRSQGGGGRSGRTTPPPLPPALQGHFSADCSSANILNVVRLDYEKESLMKSSRLTM